MQCKKVRGFCSHLNRFLAIFLFLLTWELAPRIGLVDPFFLPPLSQVIEAIIKMANNGELFKHVLASLQRTLVGFSAGLAVAVP
ncbi:MAG TPA: ABC transporter permease, partial [Negativicutes bacterium]